MARARPRMTRRTRSSRFFTFLDLLKLDFVARLSAPPPLLHLRPPTEPLAARDFAKMGFGDLLVRTLPTSWSEWTTVFIPPTTKFLPARDMPSLAGKVSEPLRAPNPGLSHTSPELTFVQNAPYIGNPGYRWEHGDRIRNLPPARPPRRQGLPRRAVGCEGGSCD